jgi:D-alanyl-D-alanine carboxypeptidase
MRFRKPAYSLMFNNTNPLVKNPDWDVRLSKTGYTDERPLPADACQTGSSGARHRTAQLGGQTHPVGMPTASASG